MSSPHLVFLIRVFTTDGKSIEYRYDLSAQSDGPNFILGELDYLKEGLASEEGIYIGETESTLYNPRNIVRIEWTVQGGVEGADLRKKVVGLNILRDSNA